MNGLKLTKKYTALDICWLAGFLVCLAMMLYKCRFGFGNADESFYLTIPYRLCMGDSLLVHEYHLSQLSAVLLYPIMQVYLWIAGTTEGIIPAFRYLYTALHSLTAVLIYWRLRKKNAGAVFASLLYLLFAPFCIMALSYNSMGVALMCISAVLIYSNETDSKIVTLIAGAAFSGAVLCCPYLLVVYLYYAIAAAVISLKNRSLKNKWTRDFLYFTASCGVCAGLLIGFLLSRSSFGQIMDALPWLLNDPQHPSRSFPDVVWFYLLSVLKSNGVALLVFLCAAVLTVIAGVSRNRKKNAPLFLLIGVALTALYALPFVSTRRCLNYLMFPLVIMGFLCFAMFRKENLKELLIFVIPGLLYGFCMNWSSNQGFYVISNAALVSSIGAILMLGNLEISDWRKDLLAKLSGLGVTALLTGLLAAAFFLRYDMTFWDADMLENTMTERIEVGANKGIYTEIKYKELYMTLYGETAPAREYPGDSVLYFSEYPWLYLDDTKVNASFSAWTSGVDDYAAQRLVQFYKMNPDKLPDIMYCSSADYSEDLSIVQYLLELGYTLQEGENAYFLIR